jgi:hypothetical protein
MHVSAKECTLEQRKSWMHEVQSALCVHVIYCNLRTLHPPYRNVQMSKLSSGEEFCRTLPYANA